ncbi:MAG: Rieske (2Fe-2S) protein [Actinomycetes bacterium]
MSRRQLLAGGAATAAGLVVLAGCGSSSGSGSTPPGTSSAEGAKAGPLTAVSNVPVGGAVSVKGSGGAPLIVSQPTAGKVVAFSAICTHMGCLVAPAGKQLLCPCHGSLYDAATGKNLTGPAPLPLPEVPVHVVGDQVLPGA